MAALAAGRLQRAWGRRRRIALAYHNVVPDDWEGGGDRSLHIPVSRFTEHLDHLSDLAEIRPLRDLVEAPAASQERPWVAITFDDAYHGALALGLREVVHRELCATVFVAPGRLGGGEFWWDTLAERLGSRFDDAHRHQALTRFSGDQESVLSALGNEKEAHPLPTFACAATEEQLRHAAKLPGVTLAAHSWSHRNLASLGGDDLESELETPIQWLAERFEGTLRYLAFPYGLYSPATEHSARDAGYAACFRVTGGGWQTGSTSAFVLPRLNVPRDLSHRGVTLRVGGLRTRFFSG